MYLKSHNKKKAFILIFLIKSSIAATLIPFHINKSDPETQLEQNTRLYNLLTPQDKNSTELPTNNIIQPDDHCYDLNNLIKSSSNFAPSQSEQFVAKKYPMGRNISSCNQSQPPNSTNAILTAKMALAVLDSDRKYKILITDFSGKNTQPIVISSSPITSISWNKSNTAIAYVSYEAGKPIIYIQNIYTGKRYIVANFDGSNSSPVFIDNTALLVSLSKDYGTHVYKIDLQNYTLKKAAISTINTNSIDTEADYGNGNLIFTSGKDDKPQIYLRSKGTTFNQQISLGKNNTTGRISGDGRKILYTHGSGGKYSLMYYNINTKTTKKIDSGKILSGSFAPDNTLISYIKNNQIIINNPIYNKSIALTGLKYREIFDIKWSK